MLDNSVFTKTMLYLQKLYGKKLEDSVLDLYWNALKNIDADQFNFAVSFIVKDFVPSSTVPFPVPAMFFKGCAQDADSLASNAIAAIKRAAENIGSYHSIDFGDGVLHAVINRFGGWPTVARFGNDDQWKYQEKNFMLAYKSALQCGERDGPVLGLFAIDNAQKTLAEPQRAIADKMSVPKRFQWSGSNQLEYKRQPAIEEFHFKKIAPEDRAGPDFLADLAQSVIRKIDNQQEHT